MTKDATFDRLMLLDRLEELREDLLELGIASLAELEDRIAMLEAEIAELPDDDVGADGSV